MTNPQGGSQADESSDRTPAPDAAKVSDRPPAPPNQKLSDRAPPPPSLKASGRMPSAPNISPSDRTPAPPALKPPERMPSSPGFTLPVRPLSVEAPKLSDRTPTRPEVRVVDRAFAQPDVMPIERTPTPPAGVATDRSPTPICPAPSSEVQSSEERPVQRFFVTDGAVTIGPVDGDLLARGIVAGKVPLVASVWCTGWDNWRSVQQYAADQSLFPRDEEAMMSARLARVTDLSPMQLPGPAAEAESLSNARDLNHAATIFLSLAAAATDADCGWVHTAGRGGTTAMVTIEGIGPRAALGAGRTVDPSDQALRVARDGRTVLGEPLPGVVGSAVTARLLATGIAPVSVMMVPVLSGGRLIVMLELGESTRPSGFTARETMVVEQIARDFGAIARKRGWHR